MAITNEIQLQNMLLANIAKAMKIASWQIRQELYINIFSNVSILPDSNSYDRTDEFLKSVINPVVKISGGSVSVEVGMDYTKMSSSVGGYAKYNQHMSLDKSTTWGGHTIPEWLLSWWDTGTSGANSPHWINKTNYWYDVMGDRGDSPNPQYETLAKTFKKVFYEELGKIGSVSGG